MTIACLIAYVLGHLLGLRQSQWAVLTSIIVMQGNVGASLKAMIDRFVGSLGGAVAGVIASLGMHYGGFSAPALALAVGLPPLTLLAAMKPAYRVTPITYIILTLTPKLQQLGPVQSAYERVLEVGVGSVIALAVSLLILPARAHDALVQAVSQALAAMADLMTALAGGLAGSVDASAIESAHARIRSAIGKAEAAADEAVRERHVSLSDAVDPLPICRTLRRLRHDIAILGRTMTSPLPGTVDAEIGRPVLDVAQAISDYFRAVAQAFAGREAPPPSADLATAFGTQSQAVAAMRRQGVTRPLGDDDLARIFGMGFALDQLRRDLDDLAERGRELARQGKAG
jgi:uncharacterized membrane protein YccC